MRAGGRGALLGLRGGGRGVGRDGSAALGSDRRPVHPPAVLRQSAQGGVPPGPRSCGQPQAGAGPGRYGAGTPHQPPPHPEHKIYPYRLRGVAVVRPNQVWSTDITDIRLAQGFAYLVAVIDWYARRVLAWRIANTLEAGFCVDCLEDARRTPGRPEVFNSDKAPNSPARASPRCCWTKASPSAGTDAAGPWTTSLSSGCGAASSEKGVTVTTLRRWLREGGEDAARRRVTVDASSAGQMGRKVSGDAVVWSRPPAKPPAHRSRCRIFDWQQ